jgi:hypothetical protein
MEIGYRYKKICICLAYYFNFVPVGYSFQKVVSVLYSTSETVISRKARSLFYHISYFIYRFSELVYVRINTKLSV